MGQHKVAKAIKEKHVIKFQKFDSPKSQKLTLIINGLRSLPRPYGMVLYRFYTYCAALDQFVYSRLNKGIYPFEYLRANLNKLKHSAQLAEKYGLRAGILSFEPRSVPDELLQKYPMLRGARVDHPLRSFRPRYNLTTAHPVVLEHYEEMLEKILREAPNIDYMTVWSNDSGAGFEYTSSLYVGRNGGGYVIREFKGENEIVKAAAANIVRFMKTLRDAGRRVNPNFRSILRSEMFYDEQDDIWEQVEEGFELEVNTLKSKGFDLGYKHPKYDWTTDFNYTGLFNQFADEEKPIMERLEAKGSNVHLCINPGTFWNQEPVLAPVYPRLLFEKLSALHKHEVSHTASMTGVMASSMAPFNINQEVLRAFQNNSSMDLDDFLREQAIKWVKEEDAASLVDAWLHADEAYRSYPPPVSVHSMWSTWYRVLVRPFVPNFEALSEEERAYYEDFHLGHVNNVVRVDFRREINFDFCTPDYARKCREAITENVFPEIQSALQIAQEGQDEAAQDSPAHKVWSHLYDRLFGLGCWYRNQRNIAAWIEGVHGYIEAQDEGVKSRCRELVRETVLDEKENARSHADYLAGFRRTAGGAFVRYDNAHFDRPPEIPTEHGERADETDARQTSVDGGPCIFVDNMHFDGPFYARLYGITGESRHRDLALENILSSISLLFNEEAGLFYHFWIEAEERPNGIFWGRGQIWAILGIVGTLCCLSGDDPERAKLLGILQHQAKRLIETQDTSGHWHTVIDDTSTYLETSIAAGVADAFYTAVRLGFLGEDVLPTAEKALEAALAEVLPDGLVDGVSYETYPSLRAEHYARMPRGAMVPWGQGPLLTAIGAYFRYHKLL